MTEINLHKVVSVRLYTQASATVIQVIQRRTDDGPDEKSEINLYSRKDEGIPLLIGED